MSLTALAFVIMYIAGVIGALVSPVVGVLAYIIVYHVDPETQWWWTGPLESLNLRLSLTLALATGLGIALRRPRLGPGGRQFPLALVGMVALLIIALASLMWGYGMSPRGAYKAEKFFKVAIFVAMFVRCVRRPEHYHLTILAWLVGVFYIGYQAFSDVGQTIGGRLTRGLGGPDFQDSNDLAIHLVATLPMIGAMFFVARTWWGRSFALVTGALTVNAIAMTRSRSALVAVFAAAIVAVLSLPRGYRAKGVVAVVAGALLSLGLVDQAWWDRMHTIALEPRDASAAARLDYWVAGIEMVRDFPMGIGLGNFQQVVKSYVPGLGIERSAHNTYIECLAELGYLGLLVLLFSIGAALWTLHRLWRQARHFPRPIDLQIGRFRTRFHLGWHTLALRSGLVAYLAGAVFLTRFTAEDMWMLIGLTACLANAAAWLPASQAAAQPVRQEPPRAVPALSGGVP